MFRHFPALCLLAALPSADAAASSTASSGGNLILRNAGGQVLHTIPLREGTPLGIGDMNSATTLTLQLSNGQGQTLHSIILAPNQPVSVLDNGDVEAICSTATTPTTCDGLPPSTPAAILAFTVSAPTPPGAPRPQIRVGTNFRVEWASAAADFCISRSPSELLNWSGTDWTQRSSTGIVANARFTALPTSNPASLQLWCFGVAGASQQRSILVDVLP